MNGTENMSIPTVRPTSRVVSAELACYLDALHESRSRAARVQPITIHHMQMAGLTFCLRMSGPALEPAVLPALAHLSTATPHPKTEMPVITFDLWDTVATGILPPRPPFVPSDYCRYGQRAVIHDGPISIMHAPTVPLLFAYNRETRHGLFWTEDATALSIYERAAPLQTLFHWSLAEFGWQIVHAAAVGTETGGVLLIGNSGAGKSTTALSCLTTENSLRLLSDDKCLTRLDPGPQAFAAFSSGKIKADMLERLPQFKDRLQGWDDHYKAGKGLVYLYPDYAARLIGSFAIKALVIPRVTCQNQASIYPVSPGNAFLVLGPSTVIWLPGAESDNYRFTADLVRRIPCYQLDLARNSERNTDAILNLLAQL